MWHRRRQGPKRVMAMQYFPPSLSVKNIVVICGTNNIQHDSVEDIKGGIIDISSQIRRIYKNSNVVCDLLPRDESWSVNRVYIKE